MPVIPVIVVNDGYCDGRSFQVEVDHIDRVVYHISSVLPSQKTNRVAEVKDVDLLGRRIHKFTK